MGKSDDQTDETRLPEELLERIDSLAIPELRAVLEHVEERIRTLRTPLEDEVRDAASGQIIAIEDHGAYALVRKHLPNPDGSGVDTDTVSLFHVRRETYPNGEEGLHWSYLGDIEDGGLVKCENCGRTFDRELTVCPHCRDGDVDATDTKDRLND